MCGGMKEVWDYYDRIVPCPKCCERQIQNSNDQEDLTSLRIKDPSDGT